MDQAQKIGVHDYDSLVACLNDNFKRAIPDYPDTDPQNMIQLLAAYLMEANRKLKESRATPLQDAGACYCVCHSDVSSRPFCLHCKPEAFRSLRDPYCETEEQFRVRVDAGVCPCRKALEALYPAIEKEAVSRGFWYEGSEGLEIMSDAREALSSTCPLEAERDMWRDAHDYMNRKAAEAIVERDRLRAVLKGAVEALEDMLTAYEAEPGGGWRTLNKQARAALSSAKEAIGE